MFCRIDKFQNCAPGGQMSHMSKLVLAIIGSGLIAMVASWQLFLFAVTSEQAGLNAGAGRSHLWLAVAAGITVCAATGWTFYFFGSHEKGKWAKVEMTPPGAVHALIATDPSNLPRPDPFDFVT